MSTRARPSVPAAGPSSDGETDGASSTRRNDPAHVEVPRHPWQVIATLNALMEFGPIAIDMYLPALPSMASALGSDIGTVEWTVSGYLVGFSLSQLVWGPLGDRLGRRRPVAAGIIRDSGSLFYVGIFAYIAGTPSSYITYHHVPANLYCVLFGASIVGIIGANMANGHLLRRSAMTASIGIGALLAMVSGIASAVAASTDWGGLPGLAPPLILYCAAAASSSRTQSRVPSPDLPRRLAQRPPWSAPYTTAAASWDRVSSAPSRTGLPGRWVG